MFGVGRLDGVSPGNIALTDIYHVRYNDNVFLKEQFAMAEKTERITFLASTSLKKKLFREAETSGVSISEIIRQRCEDVPESSTQSLSERIRRIATTLSGMSKEIMKHEKRHK